MNRNLKLEQRKKISFNRFVYVWWNQMAFFRCRKNALKLIKVVQTFQNPIVSINCQFPKHANLYLNDQSFFYYLIYCWHSIVEIYLLQNASKLFFQLSTPKLNNFGLTEIVSQTIFKSQHIARNIFDNFWFDFLMLSRSFSFSILKGYNFCRNTMPHTMQNNLCCIRNKFYYFKIHQFMAGFCVIIKNLKYRGLGVRYYLWEVVGSNRRLFPANGSHFCRWLA